MCRKKMLFWSIKSLAHFLTAFKKSGIVISKIDKKIGSDPVFS